jgi:hypothetical protein
MEDVHPVYGWQKNVMDFLPKNLIYGQHSFDGIQDTYDHVIVREHKPRLLRRLVEQHLDKKKE